MFFVNWNNGVSYNLVAQTPQCRLQTVKDVQNIPIAGGSKANPEILADVASMQRSREMAIVSHYNIRRVVDITALPAAMAGIVLFLFFTHTTLSVLALMGALMCAGVATANSILVGSFAKERDYKSMATQ
jgi:multidrug efflux pump subunit AcrB